MPLKIDHLLLFGLIAMILASSCSAETDTSDSLPYYSEATFTPKWINPDSVSADFHKVRAFNLINQNGDSITEKEFDNKIYVTDFFFTYCSGICPQMTSNMAQLQNAFLNDEDVLLLSHTVTPMSDSVPQLKAYTQQYDIVDNKWHLVTGDRQEIYDLGRNFYFVEEDLGLTKAAEDFLHTENFVLVDKNRHIRGIYNGLNQTAVDQLIADIRLLQREG